MATYLELVDVSSNSDFRHRIAVACVMAAEIIRTEDSGTANHAARIAWAKKVWEEPSTVGNSMIWPVLAQNASYTSAQILGATDSAVLTAVNAAIAGFI